MCKMVWYLYLFRNLLKLGYVWANLFKFEERQVKQLVRYTIVRHATQIRSDNLCKYVYYMMWDSKHNLTNVKSLALLFSQQVCLNEWRIFGMNRAYLFSWAGNHDASRWCKYVVLLLECSTNGMLAKQSVRLIKRGSDNSVPGQKRL